MSRAFSAVISYLPRKPSAQSACFAVSSFRAQIGAAHEAVRHGGQLGLETGGQHGEAHDLDEADVLLLDVVELGVGV